MGTFDKILKKISFQILDLGENLGI